LDEEIDGLLSEGVNFNERDNEIVGLQTEKMENLSIGATRGKALTVKEKIDKELAYVTDAMGLDVF
jgi:predicted DNA-binding protein